MHKGPAEAGDQVNQLPVVETTGRPCRDARRLVAAIDAGTVESDDAPRSLWNMPESSFAP
jgi:hypothetical protein